MSGYENLVRGTAPTHLDELRRIYCAGLARAGHRPCSATLLEWRMGRGKDPWVSVPREQVALFLRLYWSASPRNRTDMAETWADTARKVEEGKLLWNNIIGPIEATGAVLHLLGWQAQKIQVWTSAEGDRFKLGSLGRARCWKIVEAIEKSAEIRVWRKAAAHTFGSGLEEGVPYLDAPRQARNWFLKHERFAEAKAVDHIVCGGLFCTPQGDPRENCKCGKMDTPAHRYFECELLKRSEVDTIRKTQSLATRWMALGPLRQRRTCLLLVSWHCPCVVSR